MHELIMTGFFILFCLEAALVFVFALISIFLERKYLNYIRQAKPEIWKEMTTSWGMGPGMRMGLKGIMFFWKKEFSPNENELVEKIKKSHMRIVWAFFSVFPTLLIMVIYVLIHYSKR